MSKKKDEKLDARMEEIVKKEKLFKNLLLICMVGIFVGGYFMFAPLMAAASIGAVVVAWMQLKLSKEAKEVMDKQQKK